MSIEDLKKCSDETSLHPQEVTEAVDRLRADEKLRSVVSWQINQQVRERDRALRSVDLSGLNKKQGEIVGLEQALAIINQK